MTGEEAKVYRLEQCLCVVTHEIGCHVPSVVTHTLALEFFNRIRYESDRWRDLLENHTYGSGLPLNAAPKALAELGVL